jgi:hypothetical protein
LNAPTYRRWSFLFTAPALQIGLRYDKASTTMGTQDGLPFMRLTAANLRCFDQEGQFMIERQSPAVVISFTHRCSPGAEGVLKGKITFTSDSAAPTSTVPAATLYTIPTQPQEGLLKAELYSAPGDPVGSGRGTIILQGGASLSSFDRGALKITADFRDAHELWSFTFYAPIYALGQKYQYAIAYPFEEREFPGICVESGVSVGCADSTGEFTIAQRSPAIVIEFTQRRITDSQQIIKGRLTFIPANPSESK